MDVKNLFDTDVVHSEDQQESVPRSIAGCLSNRYALRSKNLKEFMCMHLKTFVSMMLVNNLFLRILMNIDLC